MKFRPTTAIEKIRESFAGALRTTIHSEKGF
jgi:hypothetical protein